MKIKIVRSFINLVFLFFFVITATAAETYTLDPMHTYVQYHISHFGFSTQTGKWFAEGTLILDQNKPQNSKINAVIHVANIDTGNPELDKDLKGSLFFDIKHFPSATFNSDTITLKRKRIASVHGILTLHGVSQPVTLDVTLTKAGVSEITSKMTVGFTAHTQIRRSDFNIITLLPGLGDKVDLTIEVEAVKNP